MSDLPPGWTSAPLAVIADVQLGRQRSPKNHVGPNMRPYLRAANVTWDGLSLDDVKEMNFSAAEVNTFRLHPGDILLSEASGSASEVGKPAMWHGEIAECCFQNTLLRVRAAHADPTYLLWFFKWLALSGQFARDSRGVGIHHLGAKALSAWIVPVAPPDGQKKIVAAIEEDFSRLNAAVTALRRTRQNLKRMRDAVLDEATGRLDGKSVTEVSFGEVLREPLRNGHSAKADPSGAVPIITLTAVTSGDFGAHNVKMTAADPTRVRNLWIQPGDILIERSNTPELVGTACLYRGSPDFAVYPDLIIRARVDDRILPEFAELVLKSPNARRYFQRRAQGISGSMPKIDQRTIEDLKFSLPSLECQTSIIREANRNLSLIKSVQVALELATKRGSVLRSSILASAFSGRLTSSQEFPI